jgi:hypothetical protein
MKRRSAHAPIRWLLLAAALAAFVLWVSGFEPWMWWKAHEAAVAARAVAPLEAPTGTINVVQPTPQGTDSSISKVPLTLHLMATRLGRNSREGYADLGVSVLSPQTYRAGAILANGARLEEIYADHVVLERDHRRSPLYIEGHAIPAGAEPTSASVITVGGTASVPASVADSRDTLTDFMRVAPVFVGDQFHALVLYPAAKADVFVRLGLEPGDQLVAIDGVTLKDSKTAIAELRQVSDGASLSVTIERGGKRQLLSLDGSIARHIESGG